MAKNGAKNWQTVSDELDCQSGSFPLCKKQRERKRTRRTHFDKSVCDETAISVHKQNKNTKPRERN